MNFLSLATTVLPLHVCKKLQEHQAPNSSDQNEEIERMLDKN